MCIRDRQDTMLLEVDPMSQEDVDAHVENVKNIDVYKRQRQ